MDFRVFMSLKNPKTTKPKFFLHATAHSAY